MKRKQDSILPISMISISSISAVAALLLITMSLTACSAGSGRNNNKTINESQKSDASANKGAGTETGTSLSNPFKNTKPDYINKDGRTVEERIKVLEGFKRVKAESGSFGEYLRKLPLKPHGSEVRYYNGNKKPGKVYEAVLDIDVGERDLQQCADAVIRLRSEYLYGKGAFDEIHFNFTNGFRADYSTWRQGNRIRVEGNKAYWVKQAAPSNDYKSFRSYLDMVFAYAGTLSLSGELKKVPIEEMKIGDVFLKGPDPGHSIIVLDMAENPDNGEKLFIVAQSYMPAQDIHILKNPGKWDGNPWYSLNFGETLVTPEWKFIKDQLVKFE